MFETAVPHPVRTPWLIIALRNLIAQLEFSRTCRTDLANVRRTYDRFNKVWSLADLLKRSAPGAHQG
jgi:hypothetical protein